jgi:hypothetical protein
VLPGKPLVLDDLQPLAELAELHGVLPACLRNFDSLLQACPSRILANSSPGGARAKLEAARRRLVQRSAISLFLAAECRRLVSQLRAAGARALVLKGADFAERLYSPSSLRSFGDMDLLASALDWECVGDTMARAGYQPVETRLKHATGYSERTWEHPAMPGARVEIHDDLVNSPTVRRGVSVRLEDLPLEAAADGGVRATPAGLLIIAAVHGAASHSFDKVQHLCDLAQIVRGRAGVIDESSLRECVAKTRSAFCVAVGLDLTSRALHEPAAAAWLDRLKLRWPRRIVRLLVTPALVARSQGTRRRAASWRRQMLRQMLKSRRPGSKNGRSP